MTEPLQKASGVMTESPLVLTDDTVPLGITIPFTGDDPKDAVIET